MKASFSLCARSIDWLNAKNLFTQPRRKGRMFLLALDGIVCATRCMEKGGAGVALGRLFLRSRVALGLHARTTYSIRSLRCDPYAPPEQFFSLTLHRNYLRSSGCLKKALLLLWAAMEWMRWMYTRSSPCCGPASLAPACRGHRCGGPHRRAVIHQVSESPSLPSPNLPVIP